VVSSTPRPHFTTGKDLVPILQEAGWAPGPVWTGRKSRPHLDSIPERPASSSVAVPTELPDPLLSDITFVYCENTLKRNTEQMNMNVGGTYSNHCPLKW
jgi:hypothetical protein